MKSNIKVFLEDLVNSFKIYEDVATTLIDEAKSAGDENGEMVFRTALQHRSESMFEVLKSLERIGNITKKDVTDTAKSFGIDLERLSLSEKIEYLDLELPDETEKD